MAACATAALTLVMLSSPCCFTHRQNLVIACICRDATGNLAISKAVFIPKIYRKFTTPHSPHSRQLIVSMLIIRIGFAIWFLIQIWLHATKSSSLAFQLSSLALQIQHFGCEGDV